MLLVVGGLLAVLGLERSLLVGVIALGLSRGADAGTQRAAGNVDVLLIALDKGLVQPESISLKSLGARGFVLLTEKPRQRRGRRLPWFRTVLGRIGRGHEGMSGGRGMPRGCFL